MKLKHLFFAMVAVVLFSFVGMTSVNAQTGPSDLWSFLRLYSEDEFVSLYNSFGEENQTYEGLSYDKSTNTLTLTNFTKDFYLSANMMGDDFKLNLVGDNSLAGIVIWGDMYGGSLNIVGDGSLIVNGSKELESAILFYAEESNAVFTVANTANVKLYATDSVVYFYATTESSPAKVVVLKNGQDISANIVKENYTHQEYLPGICYEEEYHNNYTIYTKDGKKYGLTEWDDAYQMTSSPIVYDEVTKRYFVDESFSINPDEYDYYLRFNSLDEVLAAGYVATDEEVETTSAFGMEGYYPTYVDKNGKKYIVQNYWYNGDETHRVYDILDRTMKLSDGNEYHFWSLTEDVKFEDLTESLVAEEDLYNYTIDLKELNIKAGDVVKVDEDIPDEEEVIAVKIEAAEDNTEDKAAKKEVTKLISSIVAKDEGTVDGVDEDLAKKIREKVNSGETIKVEVVTEDVKAEDVKKDAEKVEEKISGTNQKVAAYFDIDVLVKTANENLGNVTNLKDKITLAVKLPTNLPAVKAGYKRIFKVIRVHEGVAEELETTVSGDTASFESDRFSTYALTYEDVKTTTNNPATGDNVVVYIAMFVISAVIVAIKVIKK